MEPAETDSPSSTLDEKDVEKDEEAGLPHLAPIRSRPRQTASSKPLSLHSTRSHRSFGGEDGYSCFQNDEEGGADRPEGVEGEEKAGEGKEFEVKWDGESDPMNPRCRKKWNKWLIVVIAAFCSVCV